MMSCDLCGKPAECLLKEIDGEEFDVCVDCWHPLSDKISSHGRVKEIFEELETLQTREEYEETLI